MNPEQKNIKTVAELQEMQNAASGFGQVYYCRHIFPGLCGYENEDVLIDADTVKKMLPSMIGKPIYVDHQTVDLSKLPENADGWVTDAFYNPHDGWGWAKMMVVSNNGNQAIRAGQSVSNAWKPVSWGSSGSFHAIDYNRKIEDAYFTHLAIVRTPRYEQAKIFTPEEFKNYQDEKEKEYKNSKEQQEPKTMKFFTKEKKEVAAITEDTMVTIGEGDDARDVSFKEMLNAVEADTKAKKAAEAEKANAAKKNTGSEMLNEDTEVCVGDEKMPMKELMNKYNAICKKNEADEKEKKEKDEKEAKKNAEDEEAEKKKKAAEKEKENSNFNEFRNAKAIGGSSKTPPVQLRMDGVARGKIAYGAQDTKKA